MAKIDRVQFGGECIKQAAAIGTLAHYLAAVAQFRSQMDDGKKDDLHGPFRLSEAQWNEHRTHAKLNFEKTDIDDWKKQVRLFAVWTRKAHVALILKNQVDPTSEDIYLAQFPGASLNNFAKAFEDTADLMPKEE